MPPKDKPARKPRRALVESFFSSGPCAERPDWSLGSLRGALVESAKSKFVSTMPSLKEK